MGQVTFKLEGAEAGAVAAFLKVIDVQKKAETGLDRMGQKGKQADNSFQAMGKNMTRDLTGMVMKFVSIGAAIGVVRSAWQLYQKDIADSVVSMKAFQNEFINLQFLGEHYKDPGLRERIHELAKETGLPAPELAKGIYALESMSAYATPKEREGMLTELIKLRRTVSTPLTELVPTYTKMKAIYPDLQPVEQSNITQFLLEQAAISDPAELASQAPRIFASGKMGKMGPRTAAAIGAVLTAKTGTTARAVAGMEVIVNKLMLTNADEAESLKNLAFGETSPLAGKKALMAQAGITEADDAYRRIMKMSELHKRRPLSAQDLKDLLGERGMKYGRVLFDDPEALKSMVAKFEAETGPDKDIVGTKLRHVLKTDPTYKGLVTGEKLTAGAEAARQLPENIIWANLDKAFERIRLEKGLGIGARLEAGWAKTSAQMIAKPVVGTEEAAIGALVRYMFAVNYGGEFKDLPSKSREMLGLDTVIEKLGEAADKTIEAANRTIDASRRTANVNANVETSDFGYEGD